MEIPLDLFDEQRLPRFGTANPERMRVPFWDWMIRGDGKADEDDRDLGDRSGYTPTEARKLLGRPLGPLGENAPVWTFSRSGKTRTELPDGRAICVGGEHEDSYDPDFQIFNDVIVFHPDGGFEIYGYPRDVFPPTDSHTATRLGDQLLLIGNFGYPEQRRHGHTPIYSLDLGSYQIRAVPTTGDMPGWIRGHVACRNDEGLILVEGGEVLVATADGDRSVPNFEAYALDPNSWAWTRLTRRNWRQITIRPGIGRHQWDRAPYCRELYPTTIDHVSKPCPAWTEVRFFVQGVPVHVGKSSRSVEITFEGDAPADLVARVVEEIRTNVERAIGMACRVV